MLRLGRMCCLAKQLNCGILLYGKVQVEAVGCMLSTQVSLSHLPVPPLQQTMEKYIASIHPLVSDDQFVKAQQVVADFLEYPGPQLQEMLEQRARDKINWLSDWWIDVAYLNSRAPLVVNFNPALVFPLQEYRGESEQLRFAARLISGVLEYRRKIDEQSLEVDKLGGCPLCMMQYYQILSACRIPGSPTDTHVIQPSVGDRRPQHITVMHSNHIFSMDVYDSKGRSLSDEQLLQQLCMIMEQSQHPCTEPVGLATSLDRDTWAQVYADLMTDQSNDCNLRNIQRSIFVLCLDKHVCHGNMLPPPSLVCGEILHGGGADLNSGNRWFDKTLQLMVGVDGACGLNYEHTTAEGPAIAALMDCILDYVRTSEVRPVPPTHRMNCPTRLDFRFSPKVSEAIKHASKEMELIVTDTQITVFTFDDFGKDLIKQFHLSPDGFIQMALQLTFYRLFRQPCATYETGTLRRFQLGRTDTIRSCSAESVAFTRGTEDSSLDDSVKALLMRQAVAAHRMYTDEVINGQGIDRHLLGLKLAAVERGHSVPTLYLDSAYLESLNFRLSTSQVGAKHDAIMCFGPVVPDGFGCCYNPRDDGINFAVTAFHRCPETDAEAFAAMLADSLMYMKRLLAVGGSD